MMYDLLFLHPNVPIYISDSTLFEEQWMECVVTPWMLNALIFPGPDQIRLVCRASEKTGSRLPYGEVTFTVDELKGIS